MFTSMFEVKGYHFLIYEVNRQKSKAQKFKYLINISHYAPGNDLECCFSGVLTRRSGFRDELHALELPVT